MKILILMLKGLSRLPLGVLYILSDISFFVVYYLVGYRRKVVRTNLSNAFPEKSQKERRQIERQFFRFLCDYAFETIRLLSMSAQEMRRRMVIEGVEDMEKTLEHKPFVFIYLGHYCNWEWISTMPQWLPL